ncbi:MAG: alkaline phosphatase family protein [Phycisphaerales bacterium]|nr:alkaline phosphatase family protein [Phycisphaerales bacterium]
MRKTRSQGAAESRAPARRRFRLTLAAVALASLGAAVWSGCARTASASTKQGGKVLVLGMDGLDPKLLQKLLDAGKMPNFAKLIAKGSFSPLETSMPPQSPVAWSNFISGANPGVHQIYDFVHRDPTTMRPYLSTSRIEDKGKVIPLLPDRVKAPGLDEMYGMPNVSAEQESLRKGDQFWDALNRANVDTVMYRVPATYPPPAANSRLKLITGMGTPDLMGGYGEFTAYFEDLPSQYGDEKSVAGGRLLRLKMKDDVGRSALYGPMNPNFDTDVAHEKDTKKREKDPNYVVPPHQGEMKAEVVVQRDPDRAAVLLSIGSTSVLLNEGEFSEWLPVTLEGKGPYPGASVSAIVRAFLISARPVKIYLTPMNIDPRHPIAPVSTPTNFARDVAESIGASFWTQGIPEDSKALRSNPQVLDNAGFLKAATLLEAERRRQYLRALEDFKSGVLFFYFGQTDQLAHHFWRETDPDHPAYDPEEAKQFGDVIEKTYLDMDECLAEAMKHVDLDKDTLIIMSDHGFSSFRWGFHLNTWLRDNGYLDAPNPFKRSRLKFDDINWGATRAYGVGINGLYINVAGREKNGIVDPKDKRALMEEIAAKLMEVKREGEPAIRRIYFTKDIYPGADDKVAPDMLVGYEANYRASWDTSGGDVPNEGWFEANTEAWSGDHCIAHDVVPGVFLANRPILIDNPSLSDVAPTILGLFDVAPLKNMTGRDMFHPQAQSTGGKPSAPRVE